MSHAICSRSIGWISAAYSRPTTAIAVAIVVASSTNVSYAISDELSVASQEQQSAAIEQDLPLDAFGFLGGMSEARFYEPHPTTNDPRTEISAAASLYGVDFAMMLSIAKVESDFDPRTRTGS